MRVSKEELAIRVVVRRLGRGATPFVWAINKGSLAEPIYISPDSFANMEDAYRAGQARLPEFITTARPRPGMAESGASQPVQTDRPLLDEAEADDESYPAEEP